MRHVLLEVTSYDKHSHIFVKKSNASNTYLYKIICRNSLIIKYYILFILCSIERGIFATNTVFPKSIKQAIMDSNLSGQMSYLYCCRISSIPIYLWETNNFYFCTRNKKHDNNKHRVYAIFGSCRFTEH